MRERDTFLETERLLLCRFRPEDFADFCQFAMDSERNRMIGNDDISSVEDAKALFDWLAEREPRAYAIVLKETGKVAEISPCTMRRPKK